MKNFRAIVAALLCLISGSAQAILKGSAPVPQPVPAFSTNFATASAMPSWITSTTRGESTPTATYFDFNGDLQTAAINAPRFGFDFFGNTPLGYTSEVAATNWIRNNTIQGAATGTPGTLPTHWSVVTNSNGLSTAVTSVTPIHNLACIGFRIFGTSSNANSTQLYFEATNNIATTVGHGWVTSAFMRILAGTNNNIANISLDLDQRNSGNGALGIVSGLNVNSGVMPTGAGLGRFNNFLSTGTAGAAFVSPLLTVTPSGSSVAIDITFTICMPQLEDSGTFSSVIATTTAAVTRNADSAQFATAPAALLFGEVFSVVGSTSASSTGVGGSGNSALVNSNNGTRVGIGFVSPGTVSSAFSLSNNLQGNPTIMGMAESLTTRAITNQGGAIFGGSVAGDASPLTLGPFFANSSDGVAAIGNVRSLSLWSTTLTSSQLQTATLPPVTPISFWGDSFTAGTGSVVPGINFGYVGWLGTMLNQGNEFAFGFAGQTSSFISAQMVADTVHTHDCVVIEVGRNNVSTNQSTIPFTISDIQAMINHLAPGNTCYVVLSITNTTVENSAASGANLGQYQWILAANASMASNFPGHYQDVRSAVVAASGGANDAPPNSYIYQNSVHFNDGGWQLYARSIYSYCHAAAWPACQLNLVAGTVPGPNFIQSPDNLAGADWGTFNSTTAQGQGTAPDGTNNLNTLTDNATNEAHFVSQAGLNPPTGPYTFNVFLKQNTLRWAHIALLDEVTGDMFGSIFDLQSGTVGVSNILGSPTGTSATIIPCTSLIPLPPGCGTGSYLATMTMNFVGLGHNVSPLISTSNSATPAYDAFGAPSYIGSGQSIFVWNALLTAPVSSGSATVPPSQPWVTAGYNVNTFHVASFSAANVDTGLTKASGFDFYLTGSFTNPDTSPTILTFNGDGSLTMNGAAIPGGTGGAIYSIAAKATPVTAWTGQAFGGGFYTEATLAYSPALDTTGIPAAWWTDPVEHGAESSVNADNWQGQTPFFVHFTEQDIMENSGVQLNQYSNTEIDWSGIFGSGGPCGSGYPNCLQNNGNRSIYLPVGTDLTKPHRYGLLWVPATSITLGYMQGYFDGRPTSNRVTWNQYDCTTAPSPPASSSSPWLYGVIDCQHPELVLNPSPIGTITIYSVDVWQKSPANNIVQ